MRYKKQIILITIISVLISFFIFYRLGIFSENANQINEDPNENVSSSVMWTKNYGSTGTERAWVIVEASDGGYAIAGFTRDFDDPNKNDDFWLVKTDASGNMEWDQTYDGGVNEGDGPRWGSMGLVATIDGGFLLAGDGNYSDREYSGGKVPILRYGTQYVWLVKTDEKGNMVWNQKIGGENYHIFSLILTSDGGYALTGYSWLVKIDEFGNVQWDKTYLENFGSKSVIEASEGGYVLVGQTPSAGETLDLKLIKTDEKGNIEWSQTIGVGTHDLAEALVEASDGGYVLVGTTSFDYGDSEFLLVKTDEKGNFEWYKTYGGEGHDIAHSLVPTSDGGYAIAGNTNSFGAGGYDFWLVKTDSYGNMEWNQAYGGIERDEAWSLIQSSDGGYVIAGRTFFNAPEGYDFWVVKTDEHGNIGEKPFSP